MIISVAAIMIAVAAAWVATAGALYARAGEHYRHGRTLRGGQLMRRADRMMLRRRH